MSKSRRVDEVTETSTLSGFIEVAAGVGIVFGVLLFWSSRKKEQSPQPPAAIIAAPVSASTQ